MFRMLAAALFAAALCTSAAFAQDKPAAGGADAAAEARAPKLLSVGDKAPALSIAEWVKGSPVTEFKPGHTYVVEFWATWCGPCVRAFPHLSELQKQYEGKITFIGVTSEDPNNNLEGVKKMVADKGDKMAYTVAWDNGRTTNKAFMDASGQRGIPCSFVVNGEGNIAFIGHPMELDPVLPKVLDGTYDIKAARAAKEAEAKTEMLAMQWQRLAASGKDAEANKIARQLMTESPLGKNPQFLNEVAWRIVDPASKMKEKDFDLALEAAQLANKLTEGKDAAILDTLAHAQAAKGDFDSAIETEREAIALADDPALKKELEEALKALQARAAAK